MNNDRDALIITQKEVTVTTEEGIIYLGYDCEITKGSIRTIRDWDRVTLSIATIEALISGNTKSAPMIKERKTDLYTLKRDLTVNGVLLKKGFQATEVERNWICVREIKKGERYYETILSINTDLPNKESLVDKFTKTKVFKCHTFKGNEITFKRERTTIGCRTLHHRDLKKILKLINDK